MTETRRERDLLGEREVPAGALYGVHTVRALENFPLCGRPVHRALVRGFGAVKGACAITNQRLGAWTADPAKGEAIVRACAEMADGQLNQHVVVDALQGGAGTSTNMKRQRGAGQPRFADSGRAARHYQRVSPLEDINRHQSTNDTFPTAMRVAGLWLLAALEKDVVALQEAFQDKEKAFAHIVKVAAPKCKTPSSSPWAARWAPMPRRSPATDGASTSARSVCAW